MKLTNGLEIRVKDGTLCVNGLAMTVRGARRVEAAGELELGLWAYVALVLEDQHLVVE